MTKEEEIALAWEWHNEPDYEGMNLGYIAPKEEEIERAWEQREEEKRQMT